MEATMHPKLIRFATAVLFGVAALAPAARAADPVENDEAERLDRARTAFQEIRDMKDENIPRPLMERARCVAVFPGMVKGALGWGARVGKGVMSCRDASGHWGPPIFLTVKGGSFGFQIGVEKADVVLFFMTDKSARSLMESKFTLGGKAGLAAGPVGRTAEASTDLKLDAEIYSYARSKGLFAGISLEGARVAPDEKATRRFYGPSADSRKILREHAAPANPPAAQAFVEALP
jgi:lipid-binding SYLF domain-containing protein